MKARKSRTATMVPDPNGHKPWMTRKEAAHYLGFSTATVDRLLTPESDGPKERRLRFRRVQWHTKHTPIRILAEDVFMILPPPDEMPAATIETPEPPEAA